MKLDKKAPGPPFVRRAVVVIVGIICGLELLYLVGANVFLSSQWGRRTLSPNPEKLAISWQQAWTWWPGSVHVRALEIRGRARRAEWATQVDRGRMVIVLPELLERHLRFLTARASGAEIEIEVMPPSPDPRPSLGQKSWRVTLGDLEIDTLRRFRLNDYETHGEGRTRGWARFEVRGPVELELTSLTLRNGRLRDRGETAAHALSLDGSLRITPFVVGEDTAQDLLAGLTGKVRLEAEAHGLGFLSAYLGRVPWLGLGGSGHLTADLVATNGWLAPGSQLSLAGPTVEADLFGLHAVGNGSLEGRVPEGSSHTELSLRLPSYSVTRQADGVRLLEGEELSVLVTDDSNAIDRPAQGIRLALTVSPTQVPDLAAFTVYLPRAAGLALTGGSAELSAELGYSAAERSGEGRIRLRGEQVAATFHEVDLLADVRLDSRLVEARLEDGHIGLAGTRLEIDNVHTRQSGIPRDTGWWGQIHLPEGRLIKALGDPEAPPALIAGRVEARLRDTGPLVALLEQHLPKLAWMDGLLTVHDVQASTELRLQGTSISLADLRVSGGRKGRLEILGQLDLAALDPSGVLYARWGKLSAAVALGDGERDWKLTQSRRWYEQNADRYRSSSAAASSP